MSQKGEVIWEQVIDILVPLFDEEAITLLRTLELREESKGQWALLAANKFALEQIKKDYFSTIQLALKKHHKINHLTLKIEEQDLFKPRKTKTTSKSYKSNLIPDYQFHNFVPGPSNDQAIWRQKALLKAVWILIPCSFMAERDWANRILCML
nr:hypothetical protein [Rappaport israeli]